MLSITEYKTFLSLLDASCAINIDLILKLCLGKFKGFHLMEFFLTICFISLPKQVYPQKICIYSKVLTLYLKFKYIYTQRCSNDEPKTTGHLFIHVKEVINVANCFYKNKFKRNKIFDRVVVSIGLRFLLPRKSEFLLKKSWELNVIYFLFCNKFEFQQYGFISYIYIYFFFGWKVVIVDPMGLFTVFRILES